MPVRCHWTKHLKADAEEKEGRGGKGGAKDEEEEVEEKQKFSIKEKKEGSCGSSWDVRRGRGALLLALERVMGRDLGACYSISGRTQCRPGLGRGFPCVQAVPGPCWSVLCTDTHCGAILSREEARPPHMATSAVPWGCELLTEHKPHASGTQRKALVLF